MSIYLRLLAGITFLAFTLIERANFRLDADNLGWAALLATVAFTYNYFYRSFKKTKQNTEFTKRIQTAVVS